MRPFKSLTISSLIAVLAVVLMSVRPAAASLILGNHSGVADPTTEGWTKYSGGSSTGTAVVNDGGSGIDAWKIASPASSASYLYYEIDPTSANMTDALTYGWKMSMKLKVTVGVSTGFQGDISAQVGFGASGRWGINFGMQTNGDQIVLDSGTLASYTVTGQGQSYHVYDLLYNLSTGKADLYVDGTLRLPNLANFSNPGNPYRVFWGDGAGSSVASTASWSTFQFVSLIPEPTSLTLVGLGGLVLLRRRK